MEHSGILLTASYKAFTNDVRAKAIILHLQPCDCCGQRSVQRRLQPQPHSARLQLYRHRCEAQETSTQLSCWQPASSSEPLPSPPFSSSPANVYPVCACTSAWVPRLTKLNHFDYKTRTGNHTFKARLSLPTFRSSMTRLSYGDHPATSRTTALTCKTLLVHGACWRFTKYHQ